jgi:hypothetical protein
MEVVEALEAVLACGAAGNIFAAIEAPLAP